MATNFIPYNELGAIEKALCSISSINNQDLARTIGLTDGPTSRMVDELVAAGRVVKHRDGKAVKISLPKGTQVFTINFKPQGISRP